jgi:NADH-ubiquinone oxidoreductase chain 1
MIPLIPLWLISCVAETNRTPFDFAEGESELVSGFNVEYGAGRFALIFMAEYAIILILRLITALVALNGGGLNWARIGLMVALAY